MTDIDSPIKTENTCLNKNEITDEFKDSEEDECPDSFAVSKVTTSSDSIEEFDKAQIVDLQMSDPDIKNSYINGKWQVKNLNGQKYLHIV